MHMTYFIVTMDKSYSIMNRFSYVNWVGSLVNLEKAHKVACCKWKYISNDYKYQTKIVQ